MTPRRVNGRGRGQPDKEVDTEDRTKVCLVCGLSKPLAEYRIGSWKRQPIAICKECARLRDRQYREANRERINARKREARSRDPEPDRARSRAYKAANREKILADARAYAAKRAEERKPYMQACYLANKEQLAARNREYQRQNRIRLRNKHREWERRDRAANPQKYADARHRYRALKMSSGGSPIGPVLLETKWIYWAGLCWMCADPAVEWDHVKPLSCGGSHCLANLRPACRSCNARKGNRWPWPREWRLVVQGYRQRSVRRT